MTLPMVARFAAAPEALRDLRKRVRAEVKGARLPRSSVDTLLLVLDELISNAIEHGAAYRRSAEPLRAELSLDGRDLVLVFDDDDMPSPQVELLRSAVGNDVELPDLEDERGRGLFLITTSLQGLTVEDRTAVGAGVRLTGRIGRGA